MKSDFLDDQIIQDLYDAGTSSPSGYGFLSGGYGGGVEQDQFMRLQRLHGLIEGVAIATDEGPELWELLNDINERLLAMFPDDPDLNRETVPFKWSPDQ